MPPSVPEAVAEGDSGAYRVFVSFRFAEAENEAKALGAALHALGVKAFVSGEQAAGEMLQHVIQEAFKQAEVVVIMGSKTYGAHSGALFSTLQEMNLTMKYVKRGTKKMSLFRMFDPNDDFEEMAAEMALEGYKYKLWLPGQPIPTGAASEIAAMVTKLTPEEMGAVAQVRGPGNAKDAQRGLLRQKTAGSLRQLLGAGKLSVKSVEVATERIEALDAEYRACMDAANALYEAAESERAKAKAMGLSKLLTDAKVASDENLSAAVEWCRQQGAEGVDDLEGDAELVEELIAYLKLKKIPAKNIRTALLGVGASSSAKSPRRSSAKAKAKCVFVSFRFSEAESEAQKLKRALEAKGVKTFVSGELTPGVSLQDGILGAFKEATVVVIMGTKTYGKDTGGLFSTLQEMNLTIEDVGTGEKKMYLFKMCNQWEEMEARACFSHRKYREWMPSTPIPDGAVDEIAEMLD